MALANGEEVQKWDQVKLPSGRRGVVITWGDAFIRVRTTDGKDQVIAPEDYYKARDGVLEWVGY